VRVILQAALAAAVVLLPAVHAPPAHAGTMNGIPGPSAVTVEYADCPYYDDGGSCADPEHAVVYLADDDAFTRQHELGHLFDAQRLDDRERTALAPLLDEPDDAAWDAATGEQCAGAACPSERFADAYAACRLGWSPNGGEWADAYGYSPTPRTHRRMCAAIRRYADT
jgi:hypothetical protein